MKTIDFDPCIFAEGIVQTVREALIILDEDLHVVAANPAFYSTFQVSAPETQGRLIYELGNGQWDIPRLHELLDTIVPQRESFVNYQVERRFETIGEKIMILNARQITHDQQNKKLVLLAIEDATERVRARRQVAESEARYRDLVENINSIILDFDSTGTILFFNRFSEDYFGYGRDEVVGKSLFDTILPPEALDRQTKDEMLREIFAHPERFYANETIGRRKDGTLVWFSWSARLVMLDGVAVEKIRIDGNDITSRKEAEQQKHEAAQRFETLANNITQLTWMAEPNGNIFWYNRRWRDYIGDMASSQDRELWIKRVHPEHVDRVKKTYCEAIQSGEDWKSTFPLQSGNGEYRWFLSHARPIRDEKGDITRWFGTHTDITERKQLENDINQRAKELADTNRDLESFSYSVSHDLRAPLNVINSFTAVLQQEYGEKLDQEGRGFLSHIAASVNKCRCLIDDLLNLSRVGRQQLERSEVDLSEIAESEFQELRATDPDRGVTIDIQPNLHVWADARLVRLALGNLFRNAWKFTSKKPDAHIRFGATDKDGAIVYFVRDNGVGFDMQYADKIFEPFLRAHPAKDYGGTGVGLSIVERAVSRHGGRVWAEGQEGTGTTFYFTLGAEK